MLRAHWQNWVDQEIPALGYKTPKQAVRSADGREAVEALLQDAERTAAGDPVRALIEKELIAAGIILAVHELRFRVGGQFFPFSHAPVLTSSVYFSGIR